MSKDWSSKYLHYGTLYNHIPYGSMYADDSAINITATTTTSYYPVASGLSDGGSAGMVFQNNKELLVLADGLYLANWALSVSVNNSDQNIAGSLMHNSATPHHNVETATRAKENGVVYAMAGTGILRLVVGNTVQLCVRNYTTVGAVITVNHANMSLVQIGA